MDFSSLKRSEYLEGMVAEKLDVLIIGGGITGAGISLDASARGLRVGLVEMQDFAAGTSSRSTKLVHGGLRYLKQFEFGMVSEVGKERAIVYENGPHITTQEKMILPFYSKGTFGKFTTSLGLSIYDFLADVKKNEKHYMLNKNETLLREPLLKQNGLIGSGVYVEYKTDDARLTIEVVKKAVEIGALAVNYTRVEDLIYDGRTLIGVKIKDLIKNREYNLYAEKIVNATGHWVDTLREKDNSKTYKELILTKGVHLVFDQKRFPLNNAIYFETPDSRLVFAIPRENKVYLGTTDTLYQRNLNHPRMSLEDRRYLLEAANEMFPSLFLRNDDIESSWAGIRVLVHDKGKSLSEISRKDEIFVSDSGLISIAGGKLTGYRKMAERIVNMVVKDLANKRTKGIQAANTKNIKLSGGDVGGGENFSAYVLKKIEEGKSLGLTELEAQKLVKRYGANIGEVYSYLAEANLASFDLPKELYGALKYGLDKEMVVTPLDFFNRRTSALLFNRSFVIQWKEPVINFMANYFNWDEEQKIKYKYELETELYFTVNPALYD